MGGAPFHTHEPPSARRSLRDDAGCTVGSRLDQLAVEHRRRAPGCDVEQLPHVAGPPVAHHDLIADVHDTGAGRPTGDA